MAAMSESDWVTTDDLSDPCALCVQWRCELCKQDDCPEDCPSWPGGMFAEFEPYWPDGSVVPRIYRDIHEDCQQAVFDNQADHARDADR
jgi:hypothetical protein